MLHFVCGLVVIIVCFLLLDIIRIFIRIAVHNQRVHVLTGNDHFHAVNLNLCRSHFHSSGLLHLRFAQRQRPLNVAFGLKRTHFLRQFLGQRETVAIGGRGDALLRDDLEPDERRVVQVVVVTGNFDDGAAQIEIFRILHVLVLRVELNFPIEPGFFTRPLQIWSVFHRQVHESVVVVRDQAQIGAHLEAQVWNGRDG